MAREGSNIPTARLPPPRLPRQPPADDDVFNALLGVTPAREPVRVDQATIAFPRNKGWRYRWRFADGTASAWQDAPTERSFVMMPPAACGMDVKRPDGVGR